MRLDQLYPVSQIIDIKDGLGNKTDVQIEMVGPNSKQYREASIRGARLQQGIEKTDERFYALWDQGNSIVLSGCIVGWTGLEDEHGPIAFSPEKALEIISDPQLEFIRNQLDAAFAERAKFFRKSGKST